MKPVDNAINHLQNTLHASFEVVVFSVNHLQNTLYDGFQLAVFSVTHSEPLEKIAKIVERTINILDVSVGGLSVGVLNLGKQLKNSIIVFESLRFIGVMNGIINPSPKSGRYFLTDNGNTWQKRADRITLAVHTAFKTVKGLNKFDLVSLGFMAKNAIGQLPIFILTMDTFIIASSFFSAWDNILKLPKINKEIAEAGQKIDKWKRRSMDIAFLKIGDDAERNYYKELYLNKTTRLRLQLTEYEKEMRLNEDKLQKASQLQKEGGKSQLPKSAQEKIIAECTEENKKLALEIEKVQTKLHKTEVRLEKVSSKQYRELAEELEKPNADLKVKIWEFKRINARQEATKACLRIANSVGKIAVVILALTLTAMNLFTFPYLMTLLCMGVLVDSIGWTKIVADDYLQKKTIQI